MARKKALRTITLAATPDEIMNLDELVQHNEDDGYRPNRSAMMRKLILKEHQRIFGKFADGNG